MQSFSDLSSLSSSWGGASPLCNPRGPPQSPLATKNTTTVTRFGFYFEHVEKKQPTYLPFRVSHKTLPTLVYFHPCFMMHAIYKHISYLSIWKPKSSSKRTPTVPPNSKQQAKLCGWDHKHHLARYCPTHDYWYVEGKVQAHTENKR